MDIILYIIQIWFIQWINLISLCFIFWGTEMEKLGIPVEATIAIIIAVLLLFCICCVCICKKCCKGRKKGEKGEWKRSSVNLGTLQYLHMNCTLSTHHLYEKWNNIPHYTQTEINGRGPCEPSVISWYAHHSALTTHHSPCTTHHV